MNFVNSQLNNDDIMNVLKYFNDTCSTELSIERERGEMFVKTLLGHSPSDLEDMSEYGRKESIKKHQHALNEFLNDGAGKFDVALFIFLQIVCFEPSELDEMIHSLNTRYNTLRNNLISMFETWNKIENDNRVMMEDEYHKFVVDSLVQSGNASKHRTR